jgi:GrpB-like predicted nucleotidyltransferase (UPF0157 family)
MMNPIRLMYFSPHWRQEFEQTKSMLLWATDGWVCDVVHIGSTAIEGSVAVPTIDVLAGMNDLSGLNESAGLIEGLHYRRLPAPPWCDEEYVAWLTRPRDEFPTHSVLVVKHGGAVWQKCLNVKQRLENDYLLRESLESLKRDSLQSQASMAEYTQQKDQFFSQVLTNER